MPLSSPDYQLPIFASLINKPELVSDMEEAGLVISCLVRYATRVATASRDYTQYMSLPLYTELFPQWNLLVDCCTNLYPSSRVILREERIENITLEMYDLAERLKDLSQFSGITFTENSLHHMVALKMMEVVWDVYDITNHNDERVEELMQTLNLPYSVIDRALDAIIQSVVDDDSSDDEMSGDGYEIRIRTVSENVGTYCWICYSEMSEAVALVPCGHCFCGPCISDWVNEGVGATTRCPMCRARIVTRG